MSDSFPPYTYSAKLVRAVDGDTVDLDIDMGFRTHLEIRVRVQGLDTPEVVGVDKAKAIEAREALKELLSYKRLRVTTRKTDKYGRYVADIWVEDDLGLVNATAYMIEKGYGVAYG